MQRLAWFISKAYHKNAIKLHNEKKTKEAYGAAVKATQFFNIHEEVVHNNLTKYPFIASFKSNVSRKATLRKLKKTQTLMRAELEFLQARKLFS